MTIKNAFTQALWRSCEARYQRHRELCLQLQDAHQININLLLLASELDERQLALGLTQWQQLMAAASAWDERLIGPYRRLRHLAKGSLSDQEYRQMLDVELMMERKVQKLLLHRLNQMPLGTEKGGNLALLLRQYALWDEVAAALNH